MVTAAETLGVLHDAGDVFISDLAQLQRTFLIKKGIGAVEFEQGLVGVHAGTVDAEHRLGHEGGVQAKLSGDRTDNPFEGDGIVGGGQGVGIFEVDLMLPFGDLMMGGLDLKAHGLEGLG